METFCCELLTSLLVLWVTKMLPSLRNCYFSLPKSRFLVEKCLTLRKILTFGYLSRCVEYIRFKGRAERSLEKREMLFVVRCRRDERLSRLGQGRCCREETGKDPRSSERFMFSPPNNATNEAQLPAKTPRWRFIPRLIGSRSPLLLVRMGHYCWKIIKRISVTTF